MRRLHVGDLVQVIAGKDKGKRGKVARLFDNGRVEVEGVNTAVRHTRPNQRNTEGGRLNKDMPIHASNVMLIDADSDKPTRVKASTDEDGNKIRTAVSGATLKQG